jgi:hypothetical protein
MPAVSASDARSVGIGSWWIALPIALAISLRVFSESAASASYLVAALYALAGPSHAIRALLLSWLLTMINPGLVATETVSGTGRYAVLLAATLSVLIDRIRFGRRPSRLAAYTVLVAAYIAILSVYVSPFPDVSILKIASWFIAVMTVFSAWNRMGSTEILLLSKQIYGTLLGLLLVSLPLYSSPLGYLRNGSGFQGVLNHPQAFGLTMSLLLAWTVGSMLSTRPPPWRLFAIAAVGTVVVLLTQARTAAFAAALAILIPLVLGLVFVPRRLFAAVPGVLSARFAVALGSVLLVGVVNADRVSARITEFITKSQRTDAESVGEAYAQSRGFLIERMQDNIKMSPWTGIGFGIASFPETMEIERDSVLGLPVGAPVEKGVVPLAMVEELGFPGAALVTGWVIGLAFAAGAGGFTSLAVLMAVLLTNMTEATLFSPGGMGLLMIILLGWAQSNRSPDHTV